MSSRVISRIINDILLHKCDCGRTIGLRKGYLVKYLKEVNNGLKIPYRHYATGINLKNAPRTKPLVRSRTMVLNTFYTTLPILIVAFVCVEYKRRLKSQAVQDRVRLQKEEKPIPLPTLMSKLKNEADLKDLEFTRVELEGEFDHDREVVIGYRANQQPHLTPKGSRWQKGVYIVTPFKLKETGDTVLVNRGWVPLQLADPKARVGGQVTGTQKILGLLRSTEKKNPFDFRPSQDSFNEKFFSYLNVDDIAKYLGTKCVFVDAVSSFPDGPIGGQTKIAYSHSRRDEILMLMLILGSIALFWFTKIHPQRAAARYAKMYFSSKHQANKM